MPESGGGEAARDAGLVPHRATGDGEARERVLPHVDHVLELALDLGAAGEQVAVLVVDDADVELAVLVRKRARGDDLGTPEGEVAEFVDRDLADVPGALDDVGVAGHDALDVGDDDDLVGVHVPAEHDGGRVTAATAESRDVAGVIFGEEAGDDGDDVGELVRERASAPLGLLDVDLAAFVGDDGPVGVPGFDEECVDGR